MKLTQILWYDMTMMIDYYIIMWRRQSSFEFIKNDMHSAAGGQGELLHCVVLVVLDSACDDDHGHH